MNWQKINRYLIIAFSTILITIGSSFYSHPFVNAQIPFVTQLEKTDDNSFPETPAWDLNKAYACGKYWCSDIYFYGNKLFDRDSITVALPRSLDKKSQEIALDIEQRAKFIQNIFQQIFTQIERSGKLQKDYQKYNWRFWLLEKDKPTHPLTPIVKVGAENNQTVIYIIDHSAINRPSQTLMTVTMIDGQANGLAQQELAQQWRTEVEESLNEAIWGLQMDLQRPFIRFQLAIAIAVLAIILVLLSEKLKDTGKTWNKELEKQLKEIQENLAPTPEGSSSENISTFNQVDQTDGNSSKQNSNQSLSNNLFKTFDQSRKVFADGIALSTKFLLPTKLRQKQNIVRQKINISELLINMIRLSQLTIIFGAIASIVLTFRETRFLFNLFFFQALMIPAIWIVMVLLDKTVDFWIDYALNQWAKQRQEINPSSNRPSLRVHTYSIALRSATTVFFTVLGIFLSLGVIGISPTVIASAGALAVVFAFFSRNLLEDMLNGILILATDRYAVGDIIEINARSGCVESMNLYATSLRNLYGQLTIIPNGKISTVINMTKNWSQVNLSIEVSWKNNLKEVMMILQNLADQMYEEEVWQEKMNDSATILGVDQISHQGVVIRLIIPTQPGTHLEIAREYRFRVKEAFDLAGITIGIPQQEVYYQNQNVFPRQNESN